MSGQDLIDEFDDFLARYRNSADQRWFDGLRESGLLALDWPVHFGGPGLPRAEKLGVISQLIEAGCPVFPASITVIAPMLLAHGSGHQQNLILGQLKTDPETWQHAIIDDTFWLISNDERIQLGVAGKAALHLATASCPLFEIYELKTTLRFINGMLKHQSEDMHADITELDVKLASLEGLYLQDKPELDLQIALGINQERLNSFSLLFESLGYYALLDPDPALAGNEPLPFDKERNHLKQLGVSQFRNETLQQDLAYKQLLEKMNP